MQHGVDAPQVVEVCSPRNMEQQEVQEAVEENTKEKRGNAKAEKKTVESVYLRHIYIK